MVSGHFGPRTLLHQHTSALNYSAEVSGQFGAEVSLSGSNDSHLFPQVYSNFQWVVVNGCGTLELDALHYLVQLDIIRHDCFDVVLYINRYIAVVLIKLMKICSCWIVTVIFANLTQCRLLLKQHRGSLRCHTRSKTHC